MNEKAKMVMVMVMVMVSVVEHYTPNALGLEPIEQPETFIRCYSNEHLPIVGKDFVTSVTVLETPPTIEELLDFCREMAESDNYHGLTGTMREIAEIMEEKDIEPEKIRAVVETVALYGGLHQL